MADTDNKAAPDAKPPADQAPGKSAPNVVTELQQTKAKLFENLEEILADATGDKDEIKAHLDKVKALGKDAGKSKGQSSAFIHETFTFSEKHLKDEHLKKHAHLIAEVTSPGADLSKLTGDDYARAKEYVNEVVAKLDNEYQADKVQNAAAKEVQPPVDGSLLARAMQGNSKTYDTLKWLREQHQGDKTEIDREIEEIKKLNENAGKSREGAKAFTHAVAAFVEKHAPVGEVGLIAEARRTKELTEPNADWSKYTDKEYDYTKKKVQEAIDGLGVWDKAAEAKAQTGEAPATTNDPEDKDDFLGGIWKKIKGIFSNKNGGFNWGALAGSLLGLGAAWLLGGMFGGEGIMGNILTIGLAIPLVMWGANLLGRPSNPPAHSARVAPDASASLQREKDELAKAKPLEIDADDMKGIKEAIAQGGMKPDVVQAIIKDNHVKIFTVPEKSSAPRQLISISELDKKVQECSEALNACSVEISPKSIDKNGVEFSINSVPKAKPAQDAGVEPSVRTFS